MIRLNYFFYFLPKSITNKMNIGIGQNLVKAPKRQVKGIFTNINFKFQVESVLVGKDNFKSILTIYQKPEKTFHWLIRLCRKDVNIGHKYQFEFSSQTTKKFQFEFQGLDELKTFRKFLTELSSEIDEKIQN